MTFAEFVKKLEAATTDQEVERICRSFEAVTELMIRQAERCRPAQEEL